MKTTAISNMNPLIPLLRRGGATAPGWSKFFLLASSFFLLLSPLSAQSLSPTLTYYTLLSNTFTPVAKPANDTTFSSEVVALWSTPPVLAATHANPVTLKYYVAGDGSSPVKTNAHAMVQSSGVWGFTFPRLPPGTVRYWLEADGGATRSPAGSGAYGFVVSTAYGWQRHTEGNGDSALLTGGMGPKNGYYPASSPLPSTEKWCLSNCMMTNNYALICVQSDGIAAGTSYVRTPLLKGIGNLEFTAGTLYSSEPMQYFVVEICMLNDPAGSGIWRQVGNIVEAGQPKAYAYPINTPEECYLRIRRLPAVQIIPSAVVAYIKATVFTPSTLEVGTIHADEVRTREISHPDASPPNAVTVSSDLLVDGSLTVTGEARFPSGIRFLKPLGDLSSGIYTNSAPTP